MGRRWRGLELAERLLQAEAVDQVDVVAAGAEGRGGELERALDVGVDGAAGAAALGHDSVVVARDHALELGVAGGPVDRVEDVALGDRQPARDLAVGPVEAMADDAGDSLARGRMAVDVGHELRLAEVHPHRRVAADAEVAVGAVGELEDGAVHGIEHRAHLGVGVRRHRPLAVLLRVAGGAGGGGGEAVLEEQRGVLVGCARRRPVGGNGGRIGQGTRDGIRRRGDLPGSRPRPRHTGHRGEQTDGEGGRQHPATRGDLDLHGSPRSYHLAGRRVLACRGSPTGRSCGPCPAGRATPRAARSTPGSPKRLRPATAMETSPRACLRAVLV